MEIEVDESLLNDFDDYEELRDEDYTIIDIYIVRPLFVDGELATRVFVM